MAFRRSLSIRAALLARRFNPSFSYISHLANDQSNHEDLHSTGSIIETYSTPRRSFGSCTNCAPWQFTGAFCRTGYGWVENGLILKRQMSTSFREGDTTGFPDEGPTLITDDVAVVISDAPIEVLTSQSPAVSEVAIAAADSVFPVSALQYLIDGVHSVTGVNWWASIVLTTLLIRVATSPILISILKENIKYAVLYYMLNFPDLIIVSFDKATVDADQGASASNAHTLHGMNPRAVAEGEKKMEELCKQHGVSRFTPYKRQFIGIAISIPFVLAILNMVEKVPSFKNGGALWFTDLTTPDAMFIFPILTALILLVHLELYSGLKMNPLKKNFERVFIALLAVLSSSYPQALFCYWFTSILFSLCWGFAIRDPRVQKVLGIWKVRRPTSSANSSDMSKDK